MITSSMVKAVILNTLAISREVVGEARSNPTCRSPPSPPATSLGVIVEENLKNTRNIKKCKSPCPAIVPASPLHHHLPPIAYENTRNTCEKKTLG